jgi:glutaconate CoA-transferase subunit A
MKEKLMKEKLTDLSEAVRRIPSGSRIAIGGSIERRQPTAIAREIVRQSIGNLTFYAFSTGFSVDMMAAAGLLARTESVYWGLFWHGLAPSFRRAVEAGKVKVCDCSESAMGARFLAACSGLTFMPVKALLGTDMAKQDPAVVTEVTCPFTGELYAAVRAIQADFTIMHGYRADRFGNVQWPLARDADDIDQTIARGSRRLIVTVEEIVEHEEIMRQPNLTYIPAQWVEAVALAPFGAHPLACDAYYDEDVDAIHAYAEAGRTPEGATAYLDEYVRGTATHEDYLARFGGLEALRRRLSVAGRAA